MTAKNEDVIDDFLVWCAGNTGARIYGDQSKLTAILPRSVFLVEREESIDLPGSEFALRKCAHPREWWAAAKIRPELARVAVARTFVRGENDAREDGYSIHARTIIQKGSNAWHQFMPDCRGHYTVRIVTHLLSKDGVRDVSQSGAYWGGERWVYAPGKRTPDVLEMIRWMDEYTGVCAAVAVANFDHWMVSFGYEGTPLATLKTDPYGAREAFRLRDAPPGRQRRAALRHWVREHWRRTGNDDGSALVREHLRGALRFTWNGLSCEITPSIRDIARVARPA